MQERKKEESQKPGVEYLIEQGYKKVSAKTFINDADLESFLNKDFTNINKTRALGFIQILEREYDVDLTSLKKAYLEYESENRIKEPETLFTETPMSDDKAWQKYLPYLALGLIVLGLAYYIFTIDDKKPASVDFLITHIEENKSIIKEAEKNLEKIDDNKTTDLSVVDNSTKNLIDEQDMNFDLDLDKVVLQMIKERNISTDEDNISDNIVTTTPPPVAKVTKVDKVQKPVVAKIDKPTKKATDKGNFYIYPTKKAWVGIIYLDDFTKKDFLIRTKLPLDASRDQLIVVGHNNFRIYNKSYSVKFRSKNLVRFIYRDGELMEINKKEFTRTSEGVAW